MTFGPYVGVRISGEKDALGRIRKFRVTTMDRMEAAVRDNAGQAVNILQQALTAEYTAEGSGDIAAGVQLHVTRDENSISAEFSFPGFRELSFITALGGGYFTIFPVGPYQITPQNGKYLRIQYSDGVVFTKQVVHPGFRTDVIADTGGGVLEALALNVTRAIDGSISELVME